jgi:hypothetical protein
MRLLERFMNAMRCRHHPKLGDTGAFDAGGQSSKESVVTEGQED